MSSADLFEDGYPHGTVQGWDNGCRGGACPGTLEHGMSCKRAKTLDAGDYRYRGLVAQGLSPAEIAAILDGRTEPAQPRPPAPAALKPTPVPAPVTVPEPVAVTPAAPTPDPEPTAPTAEEATMPFGTSHPDTPLTIDKWTAGLTQRQKTAKSHEIRNWCRANGFPETPTRARIPFDALAAYDAAHATEVATSPEPATNEPEALHVDDVVDHSDEPVTPPVEIPQHKRCPEKVRHATFDDAEAVRETIQARAERKGTSFPTRSYACSYCDGWHLTSQPLKNHQQPLPNPIAESIPAETWAELEFTVASAATVEEAAQVGNDYTDVLDETRARIEAPADATYAKETAARIKPEVGMRAWVRYDDGVAVVREVDGDLVRVSYLPDPRDEENWETIDWLDNVTELLPEELFTFDRFGSDDMAEDLAKWAADGRTWSAYGSTPAPEPETDRPEWADVTIPEDIAKARSLAARLEEDNAQLLEQIATLTRERDTAHTALEVTLHRWAIATATAERTTRMNHALTRRIHTQAGTIRLLEALYETADEEARTSRDLIANHIRTPWWKRHNA